MTHSGRAMGVGALVCTLLAGCASAPESRTDRSGVEFEEDKDLQQVWLAPGFRFAAYDTLVITEVRADVPKLNPDGAENLEWARGVLRDELMRAIQTSGVFKAVVTDPSAAAAGSRRLTLESVIIEYEKGGGGARYFAGLYGAGQPGIKVRGLMTDGDTKVFRFETHRSGVTASARWLGGYRSDKDIQTEDIRDLGKALTGFIRRGGPVK